MINLAVGYDTEGCQPDHAILCEAIEYAGKKNAMVIVASEARCPAECSGVVVAGGMLFNGQMIRSDVAPTLVVAGQCYVVPL